jgi:acetoacetate decarboxylase
MTKKLGMVLIAVVLISVSFGEPCRADNKGDGYSMPITAPMYGAPPFPYRDNKIMSILFKTTPEVLRELVPQPLVPNQDNLMFVYIGILNIGDPPTFSYKEMGIGIPVLFSDTPGNYCPYMYLDKPSPIVGGREMYGFPKKEADITFIVEKNRIVAKLMRNGAMLLKATLQLSEQVETIPKRPNIPWFNLKLIPSIKKDAPPEVKQITSTTISDRKVKEEHRGDVTLEFGSSPFDPLGKIEIIKILNCSYSVTDFTLGYGEIIHNYLRGHK